MPCFGLRRNDVDPPDRNIKRMKWLAGAHIYVNAIPGSYHLVSRRCDNAMSLLSLLMLAPDVDPAVPPTHIFCLAASDSQSFRCWSSPSERT